ncbi:MAG TPA: TIGR03086 family metal-binding protein [Micromonosporaceae bacterium]
MYAPVSPALTGGIGLLERAVNYALGSLQLVTPQVLTRPTPCRAWNVRALLRHLSGSLTALGEAAGGQVMLAAPGPRAANRDPVVDARQRAVQLVGAWLDVAAARRSVSVAGTPLTTPILVGAGALEVAVHGWDIDRACGADRPVPPSLAEELLELSPLLVTDDERPRLFAPRVEPSPLATPGDRLVAFLGRDPGWAAASR